MSGESQTIIAMLARMEQRLQAQDENMREMDRKMTNMEDRWKQNFDQVTGAAQVAFVEQGAQIKATAEKINESKLIETTQENAHHDMEMQLLQNQEEMKDELALEKEALRQQDELHTKNENILLEGQVKLEEEIRNSKNQLSKLEQAVANDHTKEEVHKLREHEGAIVEQIEVISKKEREHAHNELYLKDAVEKVKTQSDAYYTRLREENVELKGQITEIEKRMLQLQAHPISGDIDALRQENIILHKRLSNMTDQLNSKSDEEGIAQLHVENEELKRQMTQLGNVVTNLKTQNTEEKMQTLLQDNATLKGKVIELGTAMNTLQYTPTQPTSKKVTLKDVNVNLDNKDSVFRDIKTYLPELLTSQQISNLTDNAEIINLNANKTNQVNTLTNLTRDLQFHEKDKIEERLAILEAAQLILQDHSADPFFWATMVKGLLCKKIADDIKRYNPTDYNGLLVVLFKHFEFDTYEDKKINELLNFELQTPWIREYYSTWLRIYLKYETFATEVFIKIKKRLSQDLKDAHYPALAKEIRGFHSATPLYDFVRVNTASIQFNNEHYTESREFNTVQSKPFLTKAPLTMKSF